MARALVVVHGAAAVAFLLAVCGSAACKLLARGCDSPARTLRLLVTSGRLVSRVAMPASALLLATGIGLVAGSRGAFSPLDPWIVGALALWAASAVVGVRVHGPRKRSLATMAGDLAERGVTSDPSLRDEAGRLLPVAVTLVDPSLAVGMLWLMVQRPGAPA